MYFMKLLLFTFVLCTCTTFLNCQILINNVYNDENCSLLRVTNLYGSGHCVQGQIYSLNISNNSFTIEIYSDDNCTDLVSSKSSPFGQCTNGSNYEYSLNYQFPNGTYIVGSWLLEGSDSCANYPHNPIPGTMNSLLWATFMNTDVCIETAPVITSYTVCSSIKNTYEFFSFSPTPPSDSFTTASSSYFTASASSSSGTASGTMSGTASASSSTSRGTSWDIFSNNNGGSLSSTTGSSTEPSYCPGYFVGSQRGYLGEYQCYDGYYDAFLCN